jgi:hypothetical protein
MLTGMHQTVALPSAGSTFFPGFWVSLGNSIFIPQQIPKAETQHLPDYSMPGEHIFTG